MCEEDTMVDADIVSLVSSYISITYSGPSCQYSFIMFNYAHAHANTYTVSAEYLPA